MMRRRTSATERNTPRPDPKRKQAPDGKLGAEGAGSDQPTSAGSATNTGSARCRRGAGDSPPSLQTSTSSAPRYTAARRTPSGCATRTATRSPGSATGMDCRASVRERGCADAPWQEHWRQGGGEAA